MSEIELPAWLEVAAEAERLALACSPAELHGGLCGWLAGGGLDTRGWLAEVLANPELPAPAPEDALDLLRQASVSQLNDADFGFELLLPDDTTLPQRATAVFAWCRAFLGGFGLAVGEKSLSEDGREALDDLANLASAQMDDVADEDDEEALAEIEEYLRMVVLLLHADCALQQQRQRLH